MLFANDNVRFIAVEQGKGIWARQRTVAYWAVEYLICSWARQSQIYFKKTKKKASIRALITRVYFHLDKEGDLLLSKAKTVLLKHLQDCWARQRKIALHIELLKHKHLHNQLDFIVPKLQPICLLKKEHKHLQCWIVFLICQRIKHCIADLH